MAVLSEEQTMLRDAAKSWVREKSPVSALRALRDSGARDGFDRAVWGEMAAMGWAGIIIPEEFGGTGLDCLTLGLVLEETGRTLTASPLLSTALCGAGALMLAGNEAQKKAWLPKIAEGQVLVALAVEEAAHHDPAKIALKAEKSAAGWTLSGTKRFVIDGGQADLVLVAARTSAAPGDRDGITLFLIEAGAKGLTASPLKMADSRAAATLTFDSVTAGPETVLGDADRGFAVLDAVLDRARAGLAAEMLGGAQQAFEITLDYLKTRTQFGQPIGTFQGLQHRAAKMFTDLELTRSCVEAAFVAIDDDANDVALLASLAKARAGELYHLVSNEMVQMHGGIGMTDAHDAGLYLKRARVAEATFGSASFHRNRYATLLGY